MDLNQEFFAPPKSIFDTHAHYDDERFDENRRELLNTLSEHGVGYIINNSTDLYGSAEKCLEMSAEHGFCYTAVGIHPEAVETKGTAVDEARLRELLKRPKVVAIGEIGLDYYWSTDRKEQQKAVFSRQCELANELGVPVIIHDREAHGDTLDIIREIRPKGSLHCFSGSREMALELVKLGMYIGVGGVVTFSNARKLVETVEAIPLERILLETDAPYLSPVPYRGKTCHSAYIYYTAMKIAEIKNISVNEVLRVTLDNAKELFSIK
ncbi:MAG: TatD family hydrolase [Clostridia bacterium]|nr:TatD family hydrolase [Clostridia bacterium]